MSALAYEVVPEVEVATRGLKKALACFKPVIVKYNCLAVLVDKIALALTPGRLELWSAGGLDCDLRMELPLAGGADGGRIVVSFRQFLNLVTAIREPSLRLGIDGDRLTITPAGRSLGIPIPAACGLDDYPEPPDAAEPRETLALPGKSLAEALLRVAPFTFMNSVRACALERILLEDEPAGGVNLVASDKTKLAVAHIADSRGAVGVGKGFLGFTSREAKLIARLAGDEELVRIGCLAFDDDKRVDAVFGGNWRVTVGHETSVWPDWRVVMPNLDAAMETLEMETPPLLCALAEMRPLLEGDASAALMIHPAGRDTEGQATISGYTPCRNDDGKPGIRDMYRVSLPARRNTLAAAVRFDWRRFESVVKAMGESFVMRLPGVAEGAYHTGAAHFENGPFQALLLPLTAAQPEAVGKPKTPEAQETN